MKYLLITDRYCLFSRSKSSSLDTSILIPAFILWLFMKILYHLFSFYCNWQTSVIESAKKRNIIFVSQNPIRISLQVLPNCRLLSEAQVLREIIPGICVFSVEGASVIHFSVFFRNLYPIRSSLRSHPGSFHSLPKLSASLRKMN